MIERERWREGALGAFEDETERDLILDMKLPDLLRLRSRGGGGAAEEGVGGDISLAAEELIY